MSFVVGVQQPTGHWFSMPVGRLSLVTVSHEDQRQTRKSAITFQLISHSNPTQFSLNSKRRRRPYWTSSTMTTPTPTLLGPTPISHRTSSVTFRDLCKRIRGLKSSYSATPIAHYPPYVRPWVPGFLGSKRPTGGPLVR